MARNSLRQPLDTASFPRSRSSAAAARLKRCRTRLPPPLPLRRCRGRRPHQSVTRDGQARELHRATPSSWEARAELRFAARRSIEPSQARPEGNELLAGSERAWTELAHVQPCLSVPGPTVSACHRSHVLPNLIKYEVLPDLTEFDGRRPSPLNKRARVNKSPLSQERIM
jgi:hypothetical protein